MKKILLIAMGLGLTGCVADGSSQTQQLGMSAVKIAVNAKCNYELNQSSAWQTASKLMTQEKQQTLQNNICGCVSDKAPQSVTAVDLANAAFDPNLRTKVVATAVDKTISQCMTEVLK
ncbi:hypothetical protein [Acinetobacter sp. HY1485]|uniref:hypothetical protein n=1 Tax=Acinetobacter sp. HY1485 TaxID=2970918 RepID=UPI0022B9CE9E|nr:hypothetical protein [Acinetobacter sp. HY1485]